tara:strand:- start:25276 stop:27390 length:2115 start_codon:yes stop_codon:yes gene_type:complete
MLFLVYSSINEQSIASSLGAVDYSYYFVLRRFLPLLEQLGDVEVLSEPPTDEDVERFQQRDKCLYLSFTPPDKLVRLTACPAVPVFAWEYSTLPTEAFNCETDNWAQVLSDCGKAITHSSFAADAVRKELGDGYKIASIPAPLWDSMQPVRDKRLASGPQGLAGLKLHCTIIDSANYDISNTSVRPLNASGQGAAQHSLQNNATALVPAWQGEPVEYRLTADDNVLTLIGFNPAEHWGVWSRSGHPWIMLDQTVSGDVELEITLRGYAHNVGQLLGIQIGSARGTVILGDELKTHRLRMRIAEPCNFLSFAGVENRAIDMDDPRDLGLGISRLAVRRVESNAHDVEPYALEMSRPDLEVSGFHPVEAVGRWTASAHCDLLLPFSVGGDVSLTVELFHLVHNAGRQIEIVLGDKRETVTVNPDEPFIKISFSDVCSTDYLCFENVGLGGSGSAGDDRQLGLGISRLIFSQRHSRVPEKSIFRKAKRPGSTNAAPGILYTSIFNPNDGRKNWEDIITAFVYAFREAPHVTLLVKITNHELAMFFEDIFTFFMELHPFQCRLVFIHGYLESEEYQQLLQHSQFTVNASRGEGQCLPLMEFMSSGVPAIAPANSAMLDYVNADNAFIVDSSEELTYWPHDPRQVFRTCWHRINWQTLRDAFVASERVYRTEPGGYKAMSEAAIASQEAYCSMRVARQRLGDFIGGDDA